MDEEIYQVKILDNHKILRKYRNKGIVFYTDFNNKCYKTCGGNSYTSKNLYYSVFKKTGRWYKYSDGIEYEQMDFLFYIPSNLVVKVHQDGKKSVLKTTDNTRKG